MILKVTDLRCDVPGRTLFQGLTIILSAGQSLAVIGPSGSGKSTLISAVLGMAPTQSGSVEIMGNMISHKNPEQAARIRREHVGVVFQHGELLPDLTASENVAIAMMMASHTRSASSLIPTANRMLTEVGVIGSTRTRDLSGGERQRTALVRALSTEPALLIGDEPTGSLDTYTRDAVADLLFSTSKERNAALLVVTHDLTVAERADMILNLAEYQPNQ